MRLVRPTTGAGRGFIAPRSGKSLVEQAYQDLKLRIITCRYRPGEALSEAAICLDLQIGRTPVHQAIHRLVADGLASILPRKGVMVRPVSMDEALEIIEVRVVTECYCARLAADRADQAELQRLEGILESSAKIAKTRNVEQMMLLDREFHDVLARAAKNTVLADVLRNLHERSLRFWFISLQHAEHHLKVLAQHRAIVAALHGRNPDAAEAAMREHICAFQANVTRQM